MQCPFCGFEDTKVIDSRSDSNYSVRRRRECLSCHERFTTFETVEFSIPNVRKSNGVLEKFDASKLRRGMTRALEKRPVGDDMIENAVARIKRRFSHKRREEIAVHEIGEAVMQELRELDEVAFVRFASVYRKFQAADAFTKEVASLQKERKDKQD